ncbi:DMT family transporter [Ferrimonas kyonanensis]|uniref:DMT family transporter n=1 Tax=Ferrimonas kyonanensis TaxID=364763 RepID=UPI000419AA68|nr:DMT family transporter [Ferrimonas kyonanensis]
MAPFLSASAALLQLTHQRLSPQSDAHKGIGLALLSTALFVVVGVLVRVLSEQTMGVLQILFVRQLVLMTLLAPAMLNALDSLLTPRHLGLHVARIGGAFTALSLGFLTLGHLPLANATALGFTQVLFVALIARLWLKEAVSRHRWLTLLIGFAGVMLVVKPDFEGTALVYTATGLAGAIGAAVAVVCVRRIAQTEPRLTLLAYQAVFVGLLALIPALLQWQWPTPAQWMMLLGVGLLSSLAQWLGVSAYKLAPANVIANVEYAKILYAMAFGYWWFSEQPDTPALLGAGLILSSALIPSLARQP